MENGKVLNARSVIFSEKSTSDVEEVAENSHGDEVVEDGTGFDADSSGEAARS